MEKAKVLIIEDEVIVSHDLADMLTQWDYEVVGIVSSGEEAVEKAKETNPHLVLADIKLKGKMDGIEAARRIRDRSDVAIVYLTARTESDLFERAKKTEPHGYLTKPVAPQEVLRTVEMALYKHEMEKRLRDSEARFRAIFDQTFQFIGLMTPEGVLIEANKAALDFYGLKESDVIGLRFWEAPWWTHSPELQERLREAVRNAADGKFTRFEAFHPAPGGEIHYVDVSIKAVKDDQGKVTLLIPEGRDITERKKAEAALNAERQRFESLAENSPFGMVLIGEDGTFQYTNPKFRELFGYEPTELSCGREWFRRAFPDPSYRRFITSAWIADLDKAEPGEQRARVFTVTCKDGAEKIIHFRPVQLQTGEQLMTCEDITERQQTQDALQESQERYRQLIENSSTGIYIHQHGRFAFVNDQLAQMMGYSKEEIVGREFWHFVHPEDREKIRARGLAISEGKKLAPKVQFRITTPDGDVRWFEVLSAPIHFKGHTANMGNVMDITDRKKVEEAFKESEERFRTAFQTSPDSININRLADGVYIDINEGFTALTGYTREDVIGKSSMEIDIWDDLKDQERLVDGLRKDGYVDNLEARFRLKDGEIRTGLMSAKVISLESQPHILSVTRDIDDWKKTREALRESEQRLELALTGAGLGLWEWNLQTGKAVWSEGAFAMHGYRPGQKEPDLRTWKRTVHPDDWQRVTEGLNTHLEGRTPVFEVQYRMKAKSGQWKWVSARGKVVEHDEAGTPLRMTGTVLDITDSKLLEDQFLQSQKMEALGTLAGGIAHDVNNLLQVMLGEADMILQRRVMDEKSLKSLRAIRRAAQNGAELVKRILTFSRKAEAQMRSLNLTDEVRRVEELLRRTIPRMIAIEMSLEDNLWQINADPSQLEQILLNLAVNAKDAMPEGGRLVFETRNTTISEEYCRLHPEFSAGSYVLLAVSDTGLGMERPLLDRIFEPFFTTKQPGQGTGLGLSTVFGIVKGHGGHINCYSEAGVGTIFKVFFPAVEGDHLAETTDAVEMPAGGTETLLLVDDEESVRTLGAEMLELAGYSVFTAANGREAIHVYRQHKDKISLVVLDLVMPEMSGRQCLEELLRMDRRAKVLIASGYSADGPAKNALERGAAGFISKPFDLKQILLAVRRSLDSDSRKE